MRTSVTINDSEQQRVKQTLAINSLQRAAQPIVMITNKWSVVGRALKQAAKSAGKGKIGQAGRMSRLAGKEAWRSKGSKAAAVGGGVAAYGASKRRNREE